MKNHKCPRCSGKLYADPSCRDEEYCINCGHVEYITGSVESDLAVAVSVRN